MANLIFCLGLSSFSNMSLILISGFVLNLSVLAIAISPLTIGASIFCGAIWGVTLNWLEKQDKFVSIASHPRWRYYAN